MPDPYFQWDWVTFSWIFGLLVTAGGWLWEKLRKK